MLSGCDDEVDLTMQQEEDDDFEDRETDEVSHSFAPTRSRIARASKNKAQGLITEQLCDENVINSRGRSAPVNENQQKVLSTNDATLDEVQKSL
mmetsp:Transcript_35808/g.66850  ORF Transcript_35808/g.66850 Transcript_35808/m.66850 type:complete len:94 (-) Transcript_35808:19-300(-)